MKMYVIIFLSLFCLYRFLRKRDIKDLFIGCLLGLLSLYLSPFRDLIYYNFISIILSFAIIAAGVVSLLFCLAEFIKDLNNIFNKKRKLK